MKEKTRRLLEQNQSLIKALYRIPGAEKYRPKEYSEDKVAVNPSMDEVDRFFEEEIKTPVMGEPEIIKNDKRIRARTFREEEALDDIEFLTDLSRQAWNMPENSAILVAARKLYSRIMPNRVLLTLDKERENALGVRAFGNIRQQNNIIRGMKIPITEQSILRDVVLTGDVYYGPMMPSLWNNFITNRLLNGKVCPLVLAAPIFNEFNEKNVEEIFLVCDVPEGFSEIKVFCLKLFVLQMKKMMAFNSQRNILRDL